MICTSRKNLLLIILSILIVLIMTILSGCGSEETASTQKEKEEVVLNTMPVSEFNKLSDDGKLKYQSQILEVFGEPDATTMDNERDVWLYFDRLHNSSGSIVSIRFSFYTTEDLIKFSASMGLQRDESDFEEVQVSTTEIRSKETFKQRYGLK